MICMVYYEYRDPADGEWHLGCMPAAQALICQLIMGEDFHYVDESAIIFEGDE